MEAVLNSAKSITQKWLKTETPLTSDVSPGDDTISVLTARRFRRGDQILIRNSMDKGEFHTVADIVDCSTIRLSSSVNWSWDASECMVNKTWKKQFLQGIYLGDVVNIPKYPAIVIESQTRSSDWLTIGSTTERYDVKFRIYVDDSWQESGYAWMHRMSDALQEGLKKNFYPLLAPYNIVALTQNAVPGDKFLKVADTSELWYPARGFIEDPFHFNEISIKRIVDSTTVELSEPLCDNYLTDYNPILVFSTRLIYNSWPSNIRYGTVYKGTFLKSAEIDWFVEEQEIQCGRRGEPSLF